MKVLYILSNSNSDGSTLSFLTLLRGIISTGNNAVVVIPQKDDVFADRLTSIDVKTYVVTYEFHCWPKLFGLKRFLGYPYVVARMLFRQRQSRKELIRIIRMVNPDLIHTNVSPLDIGHYAARKCNLPHVWHIREYCDRDFSLNLFPCKSIYRKKLKSDWTISITNNLQAYNSLGNCERSSVIYDGVRSVNDAFYYPDKEKYFLCASRISEEKGHDRTIRVFASFVKKRPEYRLLILGTGYDYYVNQLKNLTRELGIESNVCFIGFTKDVDSYMRYATALLVASPSEGFGLMTAEAAFDGCLVIGYNAAGTKEILDETGGFLWNNDTEYLTAMENVAALQKEDYSTMALYAQGKAKELYSKENYISAIMSLYSRLTC